MGFSRFYLLSLLFFGLFNSYLVPIDAAQLAIIIDDVGYYPNSEAVLLQLPPTITFSILPNTPDTHKMALAAIKQQRETMIHLPMAPLGKQPLEKNTLFPDMDEQQVRTILQQAIAQVPQAKGMNNHMGSAMTQDLPAIQQFMRLLKAYPFYFIDSRTIASSQVVQAAQQAGIPVLSRQVFLDDILNEAMILKRLQQATKLARKQGYAIIIGHPHLQTLNTLQKWLATKPADIELVAPSQLISQIKPN